MDILNWLTRKLTGAESFVGLLTANGTYRPTIIVRKGTADGWKYGSSTLVVDTFPPSWCDDSTKAVENREG